MRAMRPALVETLSPAFDKYLGLGRAAEPFPVQNFVTQLAVDALDEPVFPRTAGRDEGRTDCHSQRMTLTAVYSAPLSDRTNAGLPYSRISRDASDSRAGTLGNCKPPCRQAWFSG